MRRGYLAFLMGTATDLPTQGFALRTRTQAEELLGGIREWGKVVTNLPH